MHKEPFRLLVAVNAIILCLTFSSATAWSASASKTPQAPPNDGTELYGYDSILNDLNREVDRPRLRAKAQSLQGKDPFEDILFHGGLGLATLSQKVTLDDGTHVYLGQRGMQAAFGIDLFSPAWMAEGTARTFNETEETKTKVVLQEFELKIIFRDRLTRTLGVRLGGGLTARYMTFRKGFDSNTVTTPSAVASMGLDFFLNDKVSLGVDLNGRSAMITETPDKNSLDGTLRIDFHL